MQQATVLKVQSVLIQVRLKMITVKGNILSLSIRIRNSKRQEARGKRQE